MTVAEYGEKGINQEEFMDFGVRCYAVVALYSISEHALATPPLAAFAELCIMHFYHEKMKVSPSGNTFIPWLMTVILIQNYCPWQDLQELSGSLQR